MIRDVIYRLGTIWRGHVSRILSAYKSWYSNDPAEYALAVFDSIWHSIEKMAKTVAKFFALAGVHVKAEEQLDALFRSVPAALQT